MPYPHGKELFSSLKDRELFREGILIAEGRLLGEQLTLSGLPLLGAVAAEGALEETRALVNDRCEVFELSKLELNALAGFPFHRGMLIAAERPPLLTLDEFLSRNSTPALLAVCPDLVDIENLGSLARSAFGCGADALLLGPACCDPYSRRALRTSMGTVLRNPVVSISGPSDLGKLKARGFTVAGTTLNKDAIALEDFVPEGPLAILFGNESHGLSGEWLEACDVELTLPMSHGVDSFNVSVAGAIFLYELSVKLRKKGILKS